MRLLNKIRKYHQDRVAVRFLERDEKGSKLLLIIPGGPGISNAYFDSFIATIRTPQDWAIGLLDLPNHNQSARIPNLDYSGCLDVLVESIEEINSEYETVEFWGHSFGARLALDLLISSRLKSNKASLSGLPFRFASSTNFINALVESGATKFPIDTNENFLKFWKLALPAYFFRTPSNAEIEMLSQEITWEESQSMLGGSGDIGSYDSTTDRKPILAQILQGRNDRVLPDRNNEFLKSALPFEIKLYSDAGHFLSLEKPAELARDISYFHFG